MDEKIWLSKAEVRALKRPMQVRCSKAVGHLWSQILTLDKKICFSGIEVRSLRRPKEFWCPKAVGYL